MVKWACKDAKNALDLAVGNSIFLKKILQNYKNCILESYEIDKKILNFFGNPANANIHNLDYLTNDWDKKYDVIVCNPPYSKFQSIDNRKELRNGLNKFKPNDLNSANMLDLGVITKDDRQIILKIQSSKPIVISGLNFITNIATYKLALGFSV